MNTMSKSLIFGTKLILLASPWLFNQAYAYKGGCGTLHLLVVDSIYQKYQSGKFVVSRGSYKSCDKVDYATGDCTDFRFEQGDLSYGPDFTIEFIEKNSNKTAKIRIQQNYCFFEGGNILVEQKKGAFQYQVTKATFEYTSPGLVKITSIETP